MQLQKETFEHVCRPVRPPCRSIQISEQFIERNSETDWIADRYDRRIPVEDAPLDHFIGKHPAKSIYLTDGQSKTMKIDNRRLVFKRVPSKELLPGTGIVILVTQALRNLGKNAVDNEVVQHLRGMLTDKLCFSTILPPVSAPSTIRLQSGWNSDPSRISGR